MLEHPRILHSNSGLVILEIITIFNIFI